MMFALEKRNTGEKGRRFSYYLQGVRRVLPGNYAILRYCYYRETVEGRENQYLLRVRFGDVLVWVFAGWFCFLSG